VVDKDRQETFSEFLDKEKQNKLFVRLVFTPKGAIEEFAVIYCAIIDNVPYEVVRYDCSARETIHVHHFFKKKRKRKRHLERERNYDTIEEFMETIKKNWHDYRMKFLEK